MGSQAPWTIDNDSTSRGNWGPSTPLPGTARESCAQEDNSKEALSEGRNGKIENRPKKKLIRRTDSDYSQQLRLAFQLAFLALNVWIGIEFFAWVRWAETAG